MAERTLIARVREDDANPGTLLVSAPAVGVAEGAPAPGSFLNRYGAVLTLRILGRRHTLRLPRDVHGWVVQAWLEDRWTPVAFGDPLVRLDPRGEAAASEEAHSGGARADADGEAGGAVVVRAPSEGIFYRRPAPDAPAFVEAGSPVASGTVLGLVEVMKCFNQITYGGPGLPPQGEVVRVLAEDAVEVHFGQPLFWIRPLT